MQPKKNWFLRKKDGSEYGPVSLNDLLRWSAQCRIVAGNAVSMDREEWIPVEEIPELDMNWMAHRADGKEYGPFALAAVQELFTHNVLPADAVLINRQTGEKKPLADVIALPEAGENQQKESEKEGQAPGKPPSDDATAEPQATGEKETPAEADEAQPEEKEEMGDGGKEPVDAAAEQNASESTDKADLTDRDDLVDAGDTTDGKDLTDVTPLLEQIEALRQELLAAQANAAESKKTYRARLDSLEKKLQGAQQAALDADARREALEDGRIESQQQAANDLADLRKQTAFMKKNIAVLHAELDEARRQSTLRARIIFALGCLLTLIAALFILRSAGGCRHREDIGTTTEPDSTETAAETGGDSSRPVGGTTAANTANAWPALQIDGLRVERKQDHLVIRFDDGAFASLTNFTPTAAGQLKTIVNQLRPSLPTLRLVVEGHSDDTPMRATAGFADNSALAAARAETGAAILRREGAHAVAATNAGPPPYPNDTPENRRRNRTLVIKLYRQ